MRPALNRRESCDMEYNSELLNHVSKNEKSWNNTDYNKNQKAKTKGTTG